MTDIALRTVGLGKMYSIGAERESYRTLRDALVQSVTRPLERIRHPGAATHASKELWALSGVDLEVEHGEVLGIVGSNGAGKTTLLKVLSHITEPTKGRVEIAGRVASLLEVGTGFHPELTGRENIQLNGAILGMTRAEIKSRFDEIVEFSEIGAFLDTPVKRYSSGMYVRLAFSVAAHLQPEVLMIDEVLAVGDARFQKRCLGRMGEVAREGRTVLFVSHNMQAVSGLCTRAVRLERGKMVDSGDAPSVVQRYLHAQSESGAVRTWTVKEAPGDDALTLLALRAVSAEGRPVSAVAGTESFSIEMDIMVPRLIAGLRVGFELWTEEGTIAFCSYHTDASSAQELSLESGLNRLRCPMPVGLLNTGTYFVLPRISIDRVRWIVRTDEGIAFQAHRGSAGSLHDVSARPGAVAPVIAWTRERGQFGEAGHD